MMSDYEIILLSMASLSITTTQWPLLQPFSRHTPLNRFQLFHKLPAELRTKIWRLAAITPRMVRYSEGGGKPPGVLQACYESSQETKGYYTKHGDDIKLDKSWGIFINLDLDVLYFDTNPETIQGEDAFGPFTFRTIQLMQRVPKAMRLGIKRIAYELESNLEDDPEEVKALFVELGGDYPDLEELIFIANPERPLDMSRLVPITEVSEFQNTESRDVEVLCDLFEEAVIDLKRQAYTGYQWKWKAKPILRFMRYIPVRGVKRKNPFGDGNPTFNKYQKLELPPQLAARQKSGQEERPRSKYVDKT